MGPGGRIAAAALVGALLFGACGGSAPAATPRAADPSARSAGDPLQAGYNPAAALVADDGFRPQGDGFQFENYGGKLSDGSAPLNMTAADVRTMFGDRVCADWAEQLLDSVRSKAVVGTPKEVLAALRRSLKPNPSELYTVVIFKRDGNGGHAVTPYGVEDKGGGHFNVLIYDNNWPNDSRAISFDTNANTWKYDAAINPKAGSELYDGDAKSQTIALLPVLPGQGIQPCPFCDKARSATPSTGGAPASQASRLGEIYLDGNDTDHADLLVTDQRERRIGYVNGRLVQELPGARLDQVIADQDWAENGEPHFDVPPRSRYTIQIDATRLKKADTETVGVIGPSYLLTIKNLSVHPGDKATLTIDPFTTTATITAPRSQPLTIDLGASDDPADFSVELQGASDPHHRTIHLGLTPAVLTVSYGASAPPATVNAAITRETSQGVEFFVRSRVPVSGPTTVPLTNGP